MSVASILVAVFFKGIPKLELLHVPVIGVDSNLASAVLTLLRLAIECSSDSSLEVDTEGAALEFGEFTIDGDISGDTGVFVFCKWGSGSDSVVS